MLSQAIAISNAKGGVGKTSLVANIGVVAANSGWQVLLVDLDPQGNLGADLGYRHDGSSDEGAGLARALRLGEALEPLVMVRRNLDVVPGGAETAELAESFRSGHGTLDGAVAAMAQAFAPLAEDYDLILFDCPPGDGVLGRLGLALSRALVVPVKMDAGSLDGLELMARRYTAVTASGINPFLELLGIVLFDVGLQATALRRQLVEEIRTDFGGDVRVFDSAIRHSQRAAFDMRREGFTALEYETVASEDQRLRMELLRRGGTSLRDAGPARSASASGLATDYVALANEVLGAFVELQEHPAVGVAS
jgi:cellulose biosynthesis protein BcsQ